MPTPSQQLLSRTTYLTNGSDTIWDFSFSGGYLDKTHVKAFSEAPNGARTPITVTSGMFVGPYQLQITPAVIAGQELTIYRDTPKDLPLVNFTDESGFSEIALDTNAKQAVFIAAELLDTVNTSSSYEAEAAADLAVLSATSANNNATLAAISAANAFASAASINPSAFATAAQGVKADSAVQPAALASAVASKATVTGATGSIIVPTGPDAERDAIPTVGYFRVNTQSTPTPEYFNGSIWSPLGGGGGGGGSVTPPALSAYLSAGGLQVDPSGDFFFRNSTLNNGYADGPYTLSDGLYVPNGALLGMSANVPATFLVLAILGADTWVYPAIVNVSSGIDTSEAGLITTAVLDGFADSASYVYSAAVHTNRPYRVVGRFTVQLPGPGNWTVEPTVVQPAFGSALGAVESLGYGQKWRSVSRSLGVPVVNTTTKPIAVCARFSATNAMNIGVTVESVVVEELEIAAGAKGTLRTIVPPGQTYSYNIITGLGSIIAGSARELS